jgi:hypothetical protein
MLVKALMFCCITDDPAQNGSSVPQNGALNTPHTVVNQTMSVVPMSVAGPLTTVLLT